MSGAPLYLMRHGAPTLAGRLLGRTDCPATPGGIAACVEQAGALDVLAAPFAAASDTAAPDARQSAPVPRAGGAWVAGPSAGAPPARLHLVCSDLARARACAEAIGTPVIDPRWRELDFGVWDGLAAADVDAAALGRFWNDPDAFPPPKGERWSALVARVGAALDALPDAPTLVVTHGGAMRAALHLLCGFALAQTWAFELPYACVLGIRRWPGARPNAQLSGLWP